METLGQKLAALRTAAGVSLGQIARAGGWANASSVQKYFEPAYDMPNLRFNIAQRFAASLGEGVYDLAPTRAVPVAPPASVEDVIALLRDRSIPADVRAAAAAEKLSQMIVGGA